MIYDTTTMKPANCQSCFCIIKPGEQVTQYTEHAGAQNRTRYVHSDYTGCQGALASENVRYARMPRARGNGTCHYENARDLR